MIKQTIDRRSGRREIRPRRKGRRNRRPAQSRGWRHSLWPSVAAARRAAVGPANLVACVRVEGAVYGLEVATGKLLWRRYVGFSTTAWPTIVGSDVLVTDARHNELVRLNAATGKLVWRQTIGEPFGEPLVVGPRAFLAAESGRCLSSTSPAVHGPATCNSRSRWARRPPSTAGSSGSISPATNSACIRFRSPISPASVRITWATKPPAFRSHPRKCSTNWPCSKTTASKPAGLQILSLDDRGAVAGQETETALGRVDRVAAARRRPPADRDHRSRPVRRVRSRLGEGQEALAPVATREATDRQPVVRYVAVADGRLWIGDNQLTKYAILPTGETLPVESIQNNFAGDALTIRSNCSATRSSVSDGRSAGPAPSSRPATRSKAACCGKPISPCRPPVRRWSTHPAGRLPSPTPTATCSASTKQPSARACRTSRSLPRRCPRRSSRLPAAPT